VKKKMKDPAFARGVDRDEVKHATELLGVELDAHIQTVIDAMRAIGDELGLNGSAVNTQEDV
jgi:predicted hydrolase (HD superfamily)